ncbi:MAG: radical SAM family heme chaperone HemW [bacterium]|nr:radical SAM family heme chaperone HemW [bacterium]
MKKRNFKKLEVIIDSEIIMIKNCYIHIPFCAKICSYCDFCKVLYDKKFITNYLNALDLEISKIYNNEELETIYIGGGTPSSLSYSELEYLFKIVSKLRKTSDYEFTIECNFETITEEKLKLFKKYGVNRLSFGVESINNSNLQILDRKETKNKIITIMNVARKIGFNNINIDLMYAIPNETMGVLLNDIDFILSLNPEHISTYSLMIEKNTKLYIKDIKPINEELDYEMYKLICSKLKKKYNHYEISNFAKRGYESKHNLCYWKNREYYGFGLGASSYRDNIKYTNTRSLTNYISLKYDYYNEIVTKDDKMSYEMILGLRLLNGVSKEEFRKKYNLEIEDYFDIKDLLNKNLLIDDGANYYISEDKLYVSNEILLNFIR